MGLGGLHIWHLLIIFGIVIVIFGTKRLKTLGSDLGSAIKGFRKAMDQDDKSAPKTDEQKRLAADSDDAEFAETKDKERHG
ncbi:MAG TPA: twin-arginine translocase TatA/TatE family subunit [Gammaproteobacteria bacterium]